MERFRVSSRDKVHTVGVGERGVLTATVCAVGRAASGDMDERECKLSLGGLETSNYHSVNWLRQALAPGDRIRIEVLPGGEFDSPTSDVPVRMRDLGPAARKAPSSIEEELRDTAKQLGWTLIEKSPPPGTPEPSALPFVSSLSGPTIDHSSTNGMERFRVHVRGETHTIGVPGPGVISVILTAVVRHDPGDGPQHECILELGGLYADNDTANWPQYELGPGDEVVIDVLTEGAFDPPVRLRTWDQIGEEHTEGQRAWVRKTAWDLGWTLIENHSSSET